ncbi:zinc finger protein 679-like [Cebidichthys violaceus]|uniref:zinc finger protein 679-like n=1 Tax=Cebidichthys violaceus TaxID=271503 RepID=UPI0035CA873D
MSKVQMLRCLVNQRLTAAAEEIFGLFERTIAEHEEERSALKEENERQRKLLDAVFNPQLRLHRAEDPEPPHIKEEQDELWTSQEGEQLQGLEEADVKFSFTPVKIEDDEEEAQSSELHQRQTEQMETEADGEDCGGPEPDRNSDPDSSDTDDSDDWKETREPQSGLNSLKPDEVHVSDSRCSAGEKLFTCSECGKIFRRSRDLKTHMRIHTGEKPYSCSVCKESFNQGSHLQTHMRIHTEEKPYSCSVCKESFNQGSTLQRHMRIHTGEKPYSCSVCKESFSRGSTLQTHMRIHTGEKPFSCSVCDERFRHKSALKLHMNTHTRDNRL